MQKESNQKKVGRIRGPRVQIEYDVETGGAQKKKQIPFVAGVLADLSGDRKGDLRSLKDPRRKFVEIDRDNFNTVLANIKPRLVLKVDNKIRNDDTKLPVELTFETMEDFEPQRVAEKVESLRMLMETRRRLANLKSSMDGNDKLTQLLKQIVDNQDAREKLRTEVAQRPVSQGKVD